VEEKVLEAKKEGGIRLKSWGESFSRREKVNREGGSLGKEGVKRNNAVE